MTSKSYLENELAKIYNKFSKINIKYEFKPNRLSHIIEVNPISTFESNEFIEVEIILTENFNTIYPNDNLVFISENSIVKIKNPTFTFENNNISICFKNNYIITEPIFNNYNQTFQHSGEGNFALAA